MEQNNKKTTAYSKVRNSFYKQVKDIDRKKRITVIALILATLLLASSLLLVSTLIETSGKGKYVYVYGDYKQSISTDLCFAENVQLIDMNALANYCSFEKDESADFITYRTGNTQITFENNSKIAVVNGINKEMPSNAQIKNGYCLVPLETVSDVIFGIKIESDKKSVNISKTQETMYIFDKNPKIEYTSDISSYLEYINSKDEYIYTLLNKQNPIDEDFTPKNLVEIPEIYLHEYKYGSGIMLDGTTMKALEGMLQDMEADGIDDILVQSAYRTHAYQNMLFNTYIEKEMQAGLSREEATVKANKYSARPEYSEHRTGLCVDFTTDSIHGAVDDVFETTEAFEWLAENSWKYGFVLRYPEDKEHVTGYNYESWHYRFVGVEIASVMYQTGLCYEEYLNIFGNKGE